MSQAVPPVHFYFLILIVSASEHIPHAVLDQCGNPSGISGTFNFDSLIADGYLNSTGQAPPGIDYSFDECSQTVGPVYIMDWTKF